MEEIWRQKIGNWGDRETIRRDGENQRNGDRGLQTIRRGRRSREMKR
ncbi:MAG TPA: hypothetical protein VMV04_11830 [Thermodesulfobacteriota bacterium]|nr:hypothetical protein [Thermodesulfobacteriota bacterium]